MPTNPLVSIIIPTYNRAGFIPAAVESVFAQTYKNVEIVVVDDGSTDDTPSKLEEYGGRIRVVRQANRGPAAARNRGIKVAGGEIIAFLDSDDLWLPSKLERQVALLTAGGDAVPCCLCNARLRAANGDEELSFDVAQIYPRFEQGIWLNPAEILATRFVFFNQAVAVRRWALDKIGGFDESLWLLEDWDLALRLSTLGPWAFIREPLAVWNPNGSESLVAKAQKDPISLKEFAARVHRNALQLAGNGESRRLRNLHASKLKSTQRELRALQVGRMRFWGADPLSKLLLGAERCRNAVLKRSSMFPGMKVAPMAGFELHLK